jgi:hypothetical protein
MGAAWPPYEPRRTRCQARRRHRPAGSRRLERVADVLFLAGLTMMVAVASLVAYEII